MMQYALLMPFYASLTEIQALFSELLKLEKRSKIEKTSRGKSRHFVKFGPIFEFLIYAVK